MSPQPLASVTGRLHRLFVTSTALVLLLAGVVVLTIELYKSHTNLVNRAQTFSGITAPHLANVMATESPVLASLLLDNYFSETDLLGIYVYQTDGSLLAFNQRQGYSEQLPPPSYLLLSKVIPAYQLSTSVFEYSQPVRLKEKIIGQIYLQYSLAGVIKQLLIYIACGLLIYIISLIGVYHLSKRIQRGISGPVDQIMEAMKQVTSQQHLNVRIPLDHSDGEMQPLVKGFNEMLEQIEKNASQLKAQQKAIEQHVFFDPLTGLANRRLLIQRMEREVIRSRRTGQIGALLYMDLDHFKTINDSLGHMIGDSILMGVAKRIQSALREADTPARLGGDEFVVLLPELGRNDARASHNALSVAEKIRVAISEVHRINGRVLHVTPSIGIALFDNENSNYEKLIMQADLAMYRAKEEGRNQVQFFLEQMQENADHRQQIEEKLRQAIDNNILFINYQPQVDQQGNVVGAEALVRWPDGDRLINPDAFIPIAEMSDLICNLGRWVLFNVCTQMAEWADQDLKIPLSINISPREFQQKDFVEVVEEIILTTGAKAEYLVFEITEGVLLTNMETVLERCSAFPDWVLNFHWMILVPVIHPCST